MNEKLVQAIDAKIRAEAKVVVAERMLDEARLHLRQMRELYNEAYAKVISLEADQENK